MAAAHLQLDRRQRRREPLDRQATATASSTTRPDDDSNLDGNLDLDFTSRRWTRASTSGSCTTAPARTRSWRSSATRTSGWPTASSSASSTRRATPAIPVTDFEVQIDWYENADWSWVTPRRRPPARSRRRSTVPAGTPYGMYSGAIVLTNGDDSMVVPVSVAVAATVSQDATGNITGAVAVRRLRRRRPPSRTCSTTTGRSSAPTTGPGGPSRATGGSSTWTS